MTTLYELKEIARRIYAHYGVYILPAVRFLVELIVLLLIRNSFGYNERLSSIPIILVFSLIAGLLPAGFSILIPAIVILADFYAISMEVFLAGGAIMLIMALLYLRFSPKTGYMILLMPLFFALHIPYAIPVAAGLLFGPSAAVSVACGTFLYYFLQGISTNAATLSSQDEIAMMEKASAIVKQITGNREMLLMILVFVLMTVLIYFIRRMSINHSWTIALIVGFMVEFITLLVGFVVLGLSSNIGYLVVGNIVSVGIAIVLKFLFFSVDYKRTERVQFEDDDYYYYVRAVPKIQVKPEEKQIRKYSTTQTQKKRHRGSTD